MLSFILYLFIFVVFLQLLYYLVIFGRFAFAKEQEVVPQKLPVSVIVCAKNEEENVKKFVPLLAEQDYFDFEIILIDDASSDGTLEIFEAFDKEYPNVRLVKVENNEAFWGNKKYALTLGIKAAQKDYLLFTDANCYPNSKDWITEMTAQFTDSKTIVLGYGGYEKIPKSFLNKLIRYETLLTAIQYFSWAKIGRPYMGVGRNMAYKKEVFFNMNGFINHIKIRSGADDLFINEAATSRNTAVCFSPNSFTYSNPITTFKEWMFQKKQQLITASLYKKTDKLQLGIFYGSQFLFFIFSILLLAFQFEWELVLSLLALRYLTAWIVVGFSANKLHEKDLKFWFPLAELILIFIQINIFTTNIFSKPVHWK